MTDLFLLAAIAGRPVAIATSQVDSVVDLGGIVEVPRAEPAVRGLTALRSRVVTVIDTRVALGLTGGSCDPRRAIITRVEGHHYAILVDSLDDVAPFELLPFSSGLTVEAGWRRAAVGLIERSGEPVLVIDLAVLVPQPLAA